jgi:protoporphyrinogen oxidase
MSVDYGSHRLHPSTDPEILADLRFLLGDDLQTTDRNGRVRFDGAWIDFPLSLGDMLGRLSPSTTARLVAGAARAMLRPARSGTFAEFIETGLGTPMGDLFYFPYARKIWGLEADQLSGGQARRRISADTPWRLAGKVFSRDRLGRRFFYPRGGFGQIADALASAATDLGAEVRLGVTAHEIRRSTEGHVVKASDGTTASGLILSTIPITVLARFLQPPDHVAKAVEGLRYRAMVLVYLIVSRSHWTPYDAHYFPSEDVSFTRISEPKNYRDGPDPLDRTVLCVEIPADVGDEVWSREDSALVESVRDQVLSVGLPDPGTEGFVHRVHNAYPVYRVGSESAFDIVSDWLEAEDGIISFGRQGLFAHDNTHHAMAMARDAVACVSDDLRFDRSGWKQARERFARHIVED